MLKRFRDSDGRLTITLSELSRVTASEAREYYQVGDLYYYQGRKYILRSIDPQVHFISEDGHQIFVDSARLGTFLPDVASEGSEIIRL